MKNWYLRTCFFKFSLTLIPVVGVVFFSTSLLEAASYESSVSKEPSLSLKNSIVVDNKVLASVRGHVITVYDIVKKLDMVFYRQFPEYRSSVDARLEFYRANWKLILKDAIDRELAQAYAEDKHFTVSNGDVREELEEMFGPDVMINLYNAGLTLFDVTEMLKADILLRRLLTVFVRAPVMTTITPEKLRAVYDAQKKSKKESTASLTTQQKNPEEWTWQAITIAPRAEENIQKSDLEAISDIIKKNFNGKSVSIEELKEKVGDVPCEISISQPFTSEKEALSPKIVEAIMAVPLGNYTNPISLNSRNAQSVTVWRIYRLIDKKIIPTTEETFSDVEQYLREEVAAPLIAEKTKEFFEMLRKQYGVHMNLTDKELEQFEPFRLNGSKR